MYKMIQTVMSLFILNYLSHAFGQLLLGCTTICHKGHFCKEDDCPPCPNGYYMNVSDHRQESCLRWTNKAGRNVAIIKNGSTTEDIVWGCKVGYEKKVMYVGGWECLEIDNNHGTENTSTTSTISKTTSTSVTNATTITQYTQSEIKKIYLKTILPAVLVPVIVIPVILISICFFRRKSKRKNKKKQTQSDPESTPFSIPTNDSRALNILFDKIVKVIGIQDCKILFWNIGDPSGRFGRDPSLTNETDCYQVFQNWHSLNPEIDHKRYLLEALSKGHYNFPGDGMDINDIVRYIDLHEKLNNEFRKFCHELCPMLSTTDRVSLLNTLHIKELYDLRLMNQNIEVVFTDCLAKWSYKYPYITNENKKWVPLTKIQNALEILERKDILDDHLPNLVIKIHQAMSSLAVLRVKSETHANVNI